jgi:hypothetical protein
MQMAPQEIGAMKPNLMPEDGLSASSHWLY